MTLPAMPPPVTADMLGQLRDLKPALADRSAVSRIGIFGSVARNEAHAESDIDICRTPSNSRLADPDSP